MTPGRKKCRNDIRRVVPSLLLAALACLALAPPALALDLDFDPADYFQLTFDPITFDKTEVAPGEVFHTTIRGRATCEKDIPLPVSRVTVTLRAVARQALTGASYTIHPGFTIDIDPFPGDAGQTFEFDLPLDLQFPAGATPGDYSVVWQPVEAKARISFIWTDVTGLVPAEQPMGNIAVDAAAPAPPGTAPTGAAPVPPPASSAPPTASTTPTTPGLVLSWWVLPLAGIILVIAVIGTILFLVLRRRNI